MAHPDPAHAAPELPPEQLATVKSAAGWIQQFSRTVKTCRLYDRQNPTVLRFRAELAVQLDELLRTHGPLALTFTATEVMCFGKPVHTAHSRDDSVALPFFREGIRALTLEPGITPAELDALLDALLGVTGSASAEDDLVTRLWDAALHHVSFDYTWFDGDLEGGGDEPDAGEAGAPESAARWPREAAPGEIDRGTPAVASTGEEISTPTRSDDRSIGVRAGAFDAALADLAAKGPGSQARFAAERERERAEPFERSCLTLLQTAHASAADDDDRTELARFAPRVLHEAIARGSWAIARDTLVLLRLCEPAGSAVRLFLAELMQRESLTSRRAVTRLDEQDGAGLEDFLELAAELGEPAIDWLMRVLAESDRQRVRRPLALALSELCRSDERRLDAWLTDERWYVVRNVVYILGWIGGPGLAGRLRPLVRHAEPRVRREVVTALGACEPDEAEPVLLELLDGSEPPIVVAALHQLATRKSPEVARRLAAAIADTRFHERAAEERHGILATLAAAGDDEILPALEAELQRGGWFSRGLDAHRLAVARCAAQLGTPAAIALLERGAASRHPNVRRACDEALKGARPHDGFRTAA